jgi:hypothetical protein
MDMYLVINLISQQLLPNVIPTLSLKSNVKKVYLVLAGNAFKHQADRLQQFYRDNGIDDIEVVQCQDPNDYYLLRQEAKGLFKDIKTRFPDDFITLNSSGGTKPMSFAFTQEFDNLPEKSMAIYTDTLNKKVTILNDADGLPDLPYRSVLDIENYLRLNGFIADCWIDKHCKSHDEIVSRYDLSQALIKAANQTRQPISALNAICQTSNFSQKGKEFQPNVDMQYPPSNELKTLLHLAVNHGLITWHNNSVTFTSEEAASYLGGVWLEELAYIAANEADIEHVALSLKGHQINKKHSQQEDNVTNELDVVLVNNNQMMIIEAKTVNWERNGSGQNVTLKLDSLTSALGGPFAKGLLASALKFNQTTLDRLRNKSNLTPYQVTSYQALLNHLKEWKVTTQ